MARSAQHEGLRVGELAKLAGVHVETVRYYERRGLLPAPPRTAAGYRAYPRETLVRLRRIRAGRRLAFTLDEMATLLDGDGDGTVACATLTARAEAKLAELDESIAALCRLRDEVAEVAADCCQTTDGACPGLDDPDRYPAGSLTDRWQPPSPARRSTRARR